VNALDQARRRQLPPSPLPWLGALLALYLALPLAGLLWAIASGRVTVPASGLGAALAESVLTASCTTAICAALGVPLAFVLARRHGWLTSAVGAAVLLPLALPPLMAGILLVSLIGPHGALGALAGGRLTDTSAGIVLAQTLVAAPFTIVAARSAFGELDPSLLDVATTLGLGEWARFRHVALPVAARGVGAGLVLTWLRAFGEFGATVVVAYHPFTLPVYGYVRFGGYGLDQAMAPAAAAVLSAAGVVVLARTRLSRVVLRALRHPRTPAVVTPGHPRAAHHVRSATGTTIGLPVARGSGPVTFRLDTRLGTFHLHLSHAATSLHLAILGPSGAGKTTTLRCMAGLLGPDVGEVHVGDEVISDVPPEWRRIGYVPQEPCLLPRWPVWRQVLLGTRSDPRHAAHWIERLGLQGLEGRTPEELSGGQRHRVALARALAGAPRLVLLDEPFAALDTPTRAELRRELRSVLRGSALASVLVTHDPEEAALLADEVLVIEDGSVLQAGPVAEVFAQPRTPGVARLVGITNVHRGVIRARGIVSSDGLELHVPAATTVATGDAVWWSVRPEQVEVIPASHGHDTADGRACAMVLDAVDLGTCSELRVRVGRSLELVARVPASAALAPGTACEVRTDPDAVQVWRAGGMAGPS